MRTWAGDIGLGVRLALGGGGSSIVRFVLGAVGVAVAVAVLLVAASIDTMSERYHERASADSFVVTGPVAGVDPLYWLPQDTRFRGENVEVVFVHPGGERHPRPEGVAKMPGPGEVHASPALAELLASPDGELLRPRLPEVTGVLGREVVPKPGDLIAYVGAGPELIEARDAQRVYQFGRSGPDEGMPPSAVLLILIGAVVLLVPVFLLVSSSSRIAGAERDRRLSALRLVGAGSRQVRRIAAAEALVGALAGLVAGAGLFLLVRPFTEQVELFGIGVYGSDVVPDPVLAVLIVLAVPVLAVATALFALRRTIIEPLGVVRQARPVRRRVWWRLALILAGVLMLVIGGGLDIGSDAWAAPTAAGAALVLIGLPVLLPWLVERVAGRISGGPSSWLLAIRRLQLDPGTSARVVGGIAVVLAGAIALQAMLMTMEDDLGLAPGARPEQFIEVYAESAVAGDVIADLEAVPAVRGAYPVRDFTAYPPDSGPAGNPIMDLSLMDCPAARALAGVGDCADGDVFWFELPGMSPELTQGSRFELRDFGPSASVDQDYAVVGTWTMPEMRRMPATDRSGRFTAIVTPGALGGLSPPAPYTTIRVEAGELSSEEVELLRNAAAGHQWRAQFFDYATVQDLTRDQTMFLAIRKVLYAGSVITLLLAGVSLLVLALEHIRERRRPLAMLVAAGVPRGVLARSLLWQVVLPIAIGVVVAVLTGVTLAWLVLRSTAVPLAVDWLGVGLLSGAAVLLAVLVSAMTQPFLRSATRLTSLRTE